MTEAEAKTKWCFHFIASHTDPRQAQSEYGIEHGEPSPFVHHCIGSACMAWRWRDNGSVNAVKARTSSSVGFCGLAGTPQ